MEHKKIIRERTARHSNFRHQNQSAWSGLLLGLLLFAGALLVIVLGYDQFRGRSKAPVSQSESANQLNAAAPPAPATDPAYPFQSATERQVKLPSPSPDIPIRLRQTPEVPPPLVLNEKSSRIIQYVMEKDRFGNMVGSGFINGKTVNFLADTGATMVVIPEKIALQIGLKKGAAVPFKTGGGVIMHYVTNLDTLTLGRIEMRNVAAAINPAMQDEIVLLGMSALGLMDIQMEQGSLVLKYKSTDSETDDRPEPVIDKPFKRSYKDCAGQGNKYDNKTLDCLRGQ